MVEMVGLIPSIIAWKLVKKGSTSYLIVVKDLNKLVLGFENVPIVREFLNVLPKEVIELSLNREVEFTIDIVLGIEPISIPPY